MLNGNLNQRWCIYIDILGFGDLWESERGIALDSLRELMRAIYRIGTQVYPDQGERLFVHQMGDGFAIVSEFGEPSLERPIAIAIALMRHVATTGMFSAAAIAEGEFADIRGGYPREIMNNSDGDGAVSLGDGLMTLSDVMGTGFIRAYCLNNDALPGPFLTVASGNRVRLPGGLPVRATISRKDRPVLSIDWVRATTQLLSEIQQKANLKTPPPNELVQKIRDYCAQYISIRKKWSIHLFDLLDIEV